jgi:hypothetical protein
MPVTLEDRAVEHEEMADDLLKALVTTDLSTEAFMERVARAQAHATLALSLRTAQVAHRTGP